MEGGDAPGQSRDQRVGSILSKDVEDTEGRQGRPRSHNILGRGHWLAARGKGADDVAAGRSEVGKETWETSGPPSPIWAGALRGW